MTPDDFAELEAAAGELVDVIEGGDARHWGAGLKRLKDHAAWRRFSRAVRMAAPADGPRKSPGHHLYDALTPVFNFTSPWFAEGKQFRRDQYEQAARTFAVAIRQGRGRR